MKNEEKKYANCAQCPFARAKKFCSTADGKHLLVCPTVDTENIVGTVTTLLEENGDMDFFLTSLNFGGRKITRLVETIEFAKEMNFTRLGLAFCAGLAQEAKIIGSVFEAYGFEVVSAICKVGRTTLSDFSLNENGTCKAKGVLCNPVMQAQLMNDAQTEYNVVVGLCVGHDSLFMKYAKAMSTVLVAKDRVLGHNPLAAVYTIDSFYSHIKKPQPELS